MTAALGRLFGVSGEEGAPPTVGQICSKVRVTKELVAHVAIVAALVCAVFLAVVNANLFSLLFVGAGVLGEGFFVYKIYQEHRAKEMPPKGAGGD